MLHIIFRIMTDPDYVNFKIAFFRGGGSQSGGYEQLCLLGWTFNGLHRVMSHN
jgi:hypothetical protein